MVPALNVMRRRTGVPHRIVIDEAHYFLHDSAARHLLDLDFNGYTVVTYWPSRLPAALIDVTEVILVTKQSDLGELEALRKHCAACRHLRPSTWAVLGDLRLDQAAALPITEEAGSELRVFTIRGRLTPHVRHRQKYVDVPVADSHAFVFGSSPAGTSRAHTLREFVAALEDIDVARAEGYLRRHDFSRWIDGVFGDHALARELHEHEARSVHAKQADALEQIVAAIRSRYDLTDDDVLPQ